MRKVEVLSSSALENFEFLKALRREFKISKYVNEDKVWRTAAKDLQRSLNIINTVRVEAELSRLHSETLDSK